MKKYLLSIILAFIMCFGYVNNVDAQTYSYRSTEFAYKYVVNGHWTDWSDWEKSNILITINYSEDIIKIYSATPQIYHIIKYVRNYTDSSGGKQAEYRFIDQDNDRGTLRLRIETNGNSQMYIDFNDVMWVYNVVKI